MIMENKVIDIPKIQIHKIYNPDLNVTYYDLYINGEREGRYSDIGSINWRIGLLISSEVVYHD